MEGHAVIFSKVSQLGRGRAEIGQRVLTSEPFHSLCPLTFHSFDIYSSLMCIVVGRCCREGVRGTGWVRMTVRHCPALQCTCLCPKFIPVSSREDLLFPVKTTFVAFSLYVLPVKPFRAPHSSATMFDSWMRQWPKLSQCQFYLGHSLKLLIEKHCLVGW